ncbi:MAG: glycosyltransferase [Candidatus Nealsonbacteria bacterium]|nr:glycosyltransferase [Candidatus Nealsonbacteria bacterium]
MQDLFRAENPAFRDVPWVEISGVSQQQVAEILKNSAIYLSLCRFESVGLTALEALACGCVTAGFTGFGAREYTTAKNGFWAVEDDCLDCATQLARAAQLVTDGGSQHREMLEAASISAQYYSRERFTDRIVAFWKGLLEGPGWLA